MTSILYMERDGIPCCPAEHGDLLCERELDHGGAHVFPSEDIELARQGELTIAELGNGPDPLIRNERGEVVL